MAQPQDPEAFVWWKHGVIYQIYPRSFADHNDDGIGDLQGLIRHLNYLNDGTPNSLGVDAVWLCPIFPSPQHDFGYDVSDYTDIDPRFGTLDDFDELLEEAHARGIRIIMDMVLNHSSHLHPWFLESRSSRESPQRDWYIWREGRGPGKPPNNWQSVFGGPAWEWDPRTEQYYYHAFLKEQPDFNWRNPEVKQALFGVLRFWLDRGVDGFRLDVANYYFKDAHFRDNPQRLAVTYGYGRQRHVYDKDQPELHPLFREMRALVDG
ncbi:MAG: alpha-amylase family glycosyl hydrolase, partial [Anaerolineae bacterium]